MKKLLLFILFVLIPVSFAQTSTPTPTPTPRPNPNRDCGNGLPCGVIPWKLPVWGVLESPTPFPTEIVGITNTPTITPTVNLTVTSTPTATPSITPTSGLEPTQFDNPVSTLSGFIISTPYVISGFDDTGAATELTGGVVTIFGYMRGIIEGLSLGVLTPLFTAFIFLIIFTLGIEVIRYTVPMAIALFGFIRKLIQLVLEFLPL